MSELHKRGVEVRDVTESNKRKLLAGTARGGSKPGASLGSSQALWGGTSPAQLKPAMIEIVKTAAKNGGHSDAKRNHHQQQGGGARPSGAGGRTLASAGFTDHLIDALHAAKHDSTNVMSSTIGQLFPRREYKYNGKYKDRMDTKAGEIIEEQLFGVIDSDEAAAQAVRRGGMKRLQLAACLRKLVGTAIYRSLGIDGNCTFVACSMNGPLHAEHLKMLFKREGLTFSVATDGCPVFPEEVPAATETQLLREASEATMTTLETGRLRKERLIQSTNVLPIEVQVKAETNGSNQSPKSTKVVSFDTSSFDLEAVLRGHMTRKTIIDKNGSAPESNASLFLRHALAQHTESAITLRAFIEKGYNDTTGATGTEDERTFEDHLYKIAISCVIVGRDAAMGTEGSVPGERWRTYNVLYGSNISVSMDGGATWHGTCELAPPGAAKQSARPAKLIKTG